MIHGAAYYPSDLENQWAKRLGWQKYPKIVKNRPMKAAAGRPIKASPEVGTQAERMQRLRLALGYQSQTAFAKKYGFGTSQWSNFENGFPVSRAAARQLVRQIAGLSIGWIEDAKTGDLSLTMARLLGELPDDPA